MIFPAAPGLLLFNVTEATSLAISVKKIPVVAVAVRV
jgi:hypothetical protein